MEQFYKFNELTNYPLIIAQLNVSLCSSCISSCKPLYRIKLATSLWLAYFCWITFIVIQSPSVSSSRTNIILCFPMLYGAGIVSNPVIACTKRMCDHALWARAFWMSASLAWVLVESLMPLPWSVPPGAFDTDQTSTEQTCGGTDQNEKKYSSPPLIRPPRQQTPGICGRIRCALTVINCGAGRTSTHYTKATRL